LEEWVEVNVEKAEKNKSSVIIVDAKKELDKGVKFSKVAKKYSMGIMAKNGGAMGWFKKDYLVRELKNSVESLNIGEISDILESKVGFHIVKLDDKKNIGDEIFYNVSQIFIPKLSFAEWLEDEIKNMKVRVFISGYKWDADSGFVEFENEQMQKFEKNILNNSIDDPSLLGL